MEEEVWRPIKGFEGLYEISSYGRVKSFKGKHPKILHPDISRKGYLRIDLRKNNEKHRKSIHRLVAMTFIENKEVEKNQVNHIDGNKQNNNVDNLEWCTNRENWDHAVAHNLVGQNRKQVICVENGKIYQSQCEAARDLFGHIKYENKISDVVLGIRKHYKGYHLKRI